MMHLRFTGSQSYVLLSTETTLSNHPVVHPNSSCDVHLLRSLWLKYAFIHSFIIHILSEYIMNGACKTGQRSTLDYTQSAYRGQGLTRNGVK